MSGYWIVLFKGVCLTLVMLFSVTCSLPPAITNRRFPYGSVITRILRHFHIPIIEHVYDESKRLGGEIILSIRFHKRNGEWVKVTSSKNDNTLLALKDDHMLNDIHSADQLPDFY